MALEFRIRPQDKSWTAQHSHWIETRVQQLGTFARRPADSEFWLRDRDSGSTWAYDVRLFVEPESIFVEVSSRTRALRDDVRTLYDEIRATTSVTLEDCDDPSEEVDPSYVFR